MPQLPFKQIDVFTGKPFYGNPVAVIFNADDIADEDMQRIARWTNLSETTFICAPSNPKDADYRLRIFTPGRELPFAGHPTIGSAHAVREAGLISPDQAHFIQECIAGPIPIQVDDSGGIYAKVPRPSISTDAIDGKAVSELLGVSGVTNPRLVDVGPVWLVAQLESYEALYSMTVNMNGLSDLSRELVATGVTVYAVRNKNEIHVRSFAPLEGVLEDPVCGSGNASVAAHIKETGLHEQIGLSYTACQGAAMGRDGRINVRIEGEEITIGGFAVTVVDGSINT
jgi:PhzF family phenazine biosynthesis protein